VNTRPPLTRSVSRRNAPPHGPASVARGTESEPCVVVHASGPASHVSPKSAAHDVGHAAPLHGALGGHATLSHTPPAHA
jgi:hypothetical protein